MATVRTTGDDAPAGAANLLARRLYAQGLTDFLTVLVAEQTLFTAQDSLAQSQRDVALDVVALYKAVGGGWEVAGPVTTLKVQHNDARL